MYNITVYLPDGTVRDYSISTWSVDGSQITFRGKTHFTHNGVDVVTTLPYKIEREI